MIRVCYLVDAAFLGGAEFYVSRLACALDRGRFETAVILRRCEDAGLNAWARELEGRGIPVHRTAMDLPYHPAHAAGILRVLDRLSPHVAHVNMPGPYNGQNALLVPLARLAGARTMVTEHLPMVERLAKRAALKSLAYRWLDLAVTMSRANAAYLRDRQGVPESRIRVVFNGVADAPAPADGGASMRRRVGMEEDEVLIWFVANLLPQKGLLDLLEALSAAGRSGWRLGVVGTGPELEAAVRLAAARGISDRVRFLGRLSPDEVREALPAGDLLVLPSRMEGMPYVILEAMAAGLPVVSSTVYGIPEAVSDGETGLLVAPGDTRALGRAISALVRDAALRRAMGAKARARYEAQFTLDRHVAAMAALYRGLAGGAR